jgi:Zn-finger nucleic acid-binding protein
MSERVGIEIDYCPKCRGVWLDRGELDKIVERTAVPATPAAAAATPLAAEFRGGQGEHGYRGEHDRHGEHGHREGHGNQQGRKPFWRELFD